MNTTSIVLLVFVIYCCCLCFCSVIAFSGYYWYKDHHRDDQEVEIKCPCGCDKVETMQCHDCHQPALGCMQCRRRLSPCLCDSKAIVSPPRSPAVCPPPQVCSPMVRVVTSPKCSQIPLRHRIQASNGNVVPFQAEVQGLQAQKQHVVPNVAIQPWHRDLPPPITDQKDQQIQCLAQQLVESRQCNARLSGTVAQLASARNDCRYKMGEMNRSLNAVINDRKVQEIIRPNNCNINNPVRSINPPDESAVNRARAFLDELTTTDLRTEGHCAVKCDAKSTDRIDMGSKIFCDGEGNQFLLLSR